MVPVLFAIDDATAGYHVPLLVVAVELFDVPRELRAASTVLGLIPMYDLLIRNGTVIAPRRRPRGGRGGRGTAASSRWRPAWLATAGRRSTPPGCTSFPG